VIDLKDTEGIEKLGCRNRDDRFLLLDCTCTAGELHQRRDSSVKSSPGLCGAVAWWGGFGLCRSARLPSLVSDIWRVLDTVSSNGVRQGKKNMKASQ
jgi:hypothetical protein